MGILIDAGLLSSVVGAALQEADIAPESIDLILLTHGDHGHIGGRAGDSGDLRFPDAQVVMHEMLWEAWTSDGQRGDPGAFYDDDRRSLVKALAP